jgi:hypothetical protein
MNKNTREQSNNHMNCPSADQNAFQDDLGYHSFPKRQRDEKSRLFSGPGTEFQESEWSVSYDGANIRKCQRNICTLMK